LVSDRFSESLTKVRNKFINAWRAYKFLNKIMQILKFFDLEIAN
jgi:hypothetical protein